MIPPILARSRGLRRLYGLLFAPLLEEYGLTQLEADILMFLANNPQWDTARDIVEFRYLAKSHVSAGIERLAARGYLERFTLPGNRKVIQPPAAPSLRTGGGAGPGASGQVRPAAAGRPDGEGNRPAAAAAGQNRGKYGPGHCPPGKELNVLC